LPNGVVNQAYHQQLMGAHVDSWYVVDSALPPGLQLSTSGLITGTPTLAGSYTFTIEADQSSAYGTPTVDQVLTIVITSS
jgi:large repetitive protein